MDSVVSAIELGIGEVWLLLLLLLLLLRLGVGEGPKDPHVEFLSPTQRVLNLAQPS